jgi:anti-anti-sigma factor
MTEREAFAVTVEGTDDGARIVVQGDVDIATVPRLEHALKQSLSASPAHVMIDLSAVEFVDSSGLRFLLRASQSAEHSGWSLALVRPAGSATKAFQLTGADKLLPFVCAHAEPLPAAPAGEAHAIVPHADRMLRLHIRGSLDAPRTARLATREAIYDHPAAAANLDSLTLLVSEVVTNAVTHPQLPEESNVAFTVTITPELTRVLVSDGGPGFESPSDSSAGRVQSGYGILLLDAQSSRWGVQRVPGRFTVWFEIDHPPERAAANTAPTPR